MSTSSEEHAERQLDRTLGFFSRVDNKASFVFAMDTGMLAVLFLNLRFEDFALWYIAVPGVVSVILLGFSLFFTYRCAFPHLDGGKDSLIYFREIGKRTEASFISAFCARNEEAHVQDVLAQVWRNAEILKVKFDAVNAALLCATIALIPWALFLAASSAAHGAVPALN